MSTPHKSVVLRKIYNEWISLKRLKKIPELNKSSPEEKKYRDYYTEPWMIEKVATLFKKDSLDDPP